MKLLGYIGLFLALLYLSSTLGLKLKHGSCRQCKCEILAASSNVPPTLFNHTSMAQAIGATLDDGHCSTITNGYSDTGGYGFAFQEFHSDRNLCNYNQSLCYEHKASAVIWRLGCNGGKWATCKRGQGDAALNVKIFCDGCHTRDCAEKGRVVFDPETCCTDTKETSINDLKCF